MQAESLQGAFQVSDSTRYVAALAKLYNGDKPNICQHPSCNTIILKGKTHCIKHNRPRKDQAFKFQNAHRGRH
jgi:hypothetical protein